MVGQIIMIICCLGCAALFYGIGIWADKSEKPVHFWSGSKVDPATIADVDSYNHDNAVMWKIYSIPYWIAGVLAFFDQSMIYATVLLVLACFPGMLFLVRQYMRIERRYKKR